MEFVGRNWHDLETNRADTWDRLAMTHMAKNMQTATALVDRIQCWAESSCVQDAWRAALKRMISTNCGH
eukprot:2224910-Heterocapsa_arctica.AAC.1